MSKILIFFILLCHTSHLQLISIFVLYYQDIFYCVTPIKKKKNLIFYNLHVFYYGIYDQPSNINTLNFLFILFK